MASGLEMEWDYSVKREGMEKITKYIKRRKRKGKVKKRAKDGEVKE